MADPTYEELLTASENAKRQGNTDAAKKLLDAAVKARRAAPAASPEAALEAKLPTTMQIEESIANINERQQPFLDALTMFQRGLSFGQSPNIQGAASALTGGSFLEGREAQLAREQAAEENLTFGGVPLGMLPEAAGGYGLAKSVMAPLEAAYPTLQGWLGTLLTGGAEGTIYAQGQGQDTTLGALTGAGGGALGRGVATLASKGADLLPNFSVQERAAKGVAEQGRRSGIAPEDLIPELQSQMTRLGPDATIADVDFMRPAIMGALGPRSSVEATAGMYGMATAPNRNVQDIAQEEWGNIFAPARTAGQVEAAKKLTLDEAKAIYETGLNNSAVRFKAQPFERLVDQAFGAKPTGNKKTARDAVMTFIQDKTPLLPDGKTRATMSPRDLLDIKDAIDARIKEITRTSADSKTNRALFDLSAKLNTTIKDYVPEVRDAADIYSGQYAFDAAYETGYDLGKKGLKGQSLADLQEAIQAFSPQQKAAFSEGWRKSKVESGDISGIERQIKRVGPTKSNAELEIIDTLFGPGTGQQVVDASKRITAIEATNKQALAEWEAVSKGARSPIGGELEGRRALADRLTMASQIAMNKLLGGAFQGAFGREARRMGAQGIAEANDQLINWATRSGTTPQTSEDAIREIEQYLLRAQSAPLPANLGAQAGRMGAAFERSGR